MGIRQQSSDSKHPKAEQWTKYKKHKQNLLSGEDTKKK
jgi:hypothetical protein